MDEEESSWRNNQKQQRKVFQKEQSQKASLRKGDMNEDLNDTRSQPCKNQRESAPGGGNRKFRIPGDENGLGLF